MTTIERAPLPPPSKRGRKPKADSMAALSGWRTAIEVTSKLSDALVDECKREGLTPDVAAIRAIDNDGWTGAQEVKRYPTEGYSYMVGGAFNGKELDMRPYGDAKFIPLGVEDEYRVDWYERGNAGCYIWVATVTPEGIELRMTQ